MASTAIRMKWYARPTFWLFIVGSWLAVFALASPVGWWKWLIWFFALVLINSRNPGSKGKSTDLPTTDAPEPVSSETLFNAKKLSAISYFFTGRSKQAKLELELAQHHTYQKSLATEIEYFKVLLSEFPDFSTATDNEEQILVIENVSLVEPRKGPRVTKSGSRSSGRAFIGLPVGGVFVGASGRSSSNSTSVSTEGVEELTIVEENGRLIASSQGIAYVGEMFNRSADYSKIIDWTGEGLQLRISASSRGTNWIVLFSRQADMWAAGTLLDAADEIPARKLDTSGQASAEEIASAIEQSKAMQNEKFTEATQIAGADVAAIQTHIELLRKQYPTWIKSR